MIDNSKLAVATAVTVIGVGAILMRLKPPPKQKEETWESHIPTRHGSVEEIQPNLYLLEADGCAYGPPTRNMTIFRVQDRLVLISAIAVKEETLQEILKLGTPSVLVVPNTMHRCCAGVWKARFPEITVVCPSLNCPKDARAKIEEVVSVDMTLEELCQQDDWKNWLTPRRIEGWAHFEEILQVKLTDKKNAMIVTDLLFTIRKEKDAGMLTSMVEWFFDSSIDTPEPGKIVVPKVSRVARLFGIQDWKQAENWYRNYAKEEGSNLAAIVVGHGRPVIELKEGEGCTDALIGVADQLKVPRW